MLLTEFLGTQGASWELQQTARTVNLPPPPVVQLPALPPATTACDLSALTDVLGPAAATALRAQLGTTELAAALAGNLSEQRAKLGSYADMIDAQIAALTGQLTQHTELQDGLSAAQSVLGSAQAIIGDSTVTAIGAACPAAGYLLTLAGSALGDATAALTGAASMIEAAESKLTGLLSARGLTDGLLAELDARIAVLPGLLDLF